MQNTMKYLHFASLVGQINELKYKNITKLYNKCLYLRIISLKPLKNDIFEEFFNAPFALI